MPEAFISAADTAAYPMHMHPLSTAVWVQLITGKKTWWMYKYDKQIADSHFYPDDPHNGFTFAADARSPDLKTHPRFRDATGWEVTIEAGDILWMPAGTIHQVWTHDVSYMIAFQHLDWYSISAIQTLPERYATNFDEKCRPILERLGLPCWDPEDGLDLIDHLLLKDSSLQDVLKSSHPALRARFTTNCHRSFASRTKGQYY